MVRLQALTRLLRIILKLNLVILSSLGIIFPSKFLAAMKLPFLEKIALKTYITREEKSLPGHKPMKDRLTLL